MDGLRAGLRGARNGLRRRRKRAGKTKVAARKSFQWRLMAAAAVHRLCVTHCGPLRDAHLKSMLTRQGTGLKL